ncbi:MAG: hypothetical protein II720_01895 [Bacteroidales bacterium]|nr:hypothetical protein [Bacteroidales bacterium]
MELNQKRNYQAPHTEALEVQTEDGLLTVSNGVTEKYGKSANSYNDSDFN